MFKFKVWIFILILSKFACNNIDKEAYHTLNSREYFSYTSEFSGNKTLIKQEIDTVINALNYKKEAWLYCYLAELHYELDDYENAIRNYQICLDSNYLNLGIQFFHKGVTEFNLDNFIVAREDFISAREIFIQRKMGLFNQDNLSDWDFVEITNCEKNVDQIDSLLGLIKQKTNQ